jgi:hypothetical protein
VAGRTSRRIRRDRKQIVSYCLAGLAERCAAPQFAPAAGPLVHEASAEDVARAVKESENAWHMAAGREELLSPVAYRWDRGLTMRRAADAQERHVSCASPGYALVSQALG